ncbi:MAG: hypothetical protein OER88_08810, partial [Planctomycetota bacterium]|nr:hypothetical protein [Planctomycetota bacterium]
MFGGISAAGPHHLVFATFEGSVVWFDVDAGAVVNYCAIYPGGPEHVHCSAALAGTDGGVWVCDVNHRRVREIAPDGWQRLVVGGLPTPGVDHQDDPGVLWEPCALALFAGDLVVGNGGFDMEHGVQRFSPDDGTYRGGLERDEGWKRAQGLAVVGDELWVAESEADRVCRYAASGQCLDVARPHPDFRRPFRLEAWPDGGALLVMAPEDENDLDKCGVALLDGEATFTRWFLRAGEGHGEVTCPYD